MSLPIVLEAQAQNGEGDPASPVSRQSLDLSALRRASLAACLGGDAAKLSPAGWTPPSRNPLASSWIPESRASTPESTRQVSVLLCYFRVFRWTSRGVDSQKNRPDASDMPRCAPPYTVLARRDPQNYAATLARLAGPRTGPRFGLWGPPRHPYRDRLCEWSPTRASPEHIKYIRPWSKFVPSKSVRRTLSYPARSPTPHLPV